MGDRKANEKKKQSACRKAFLKVENGKTPVRKKNPEVTKVSLNCS